VSRSLFPQQLSLKQPFVRRFLFGLFILLFTLLVFYLDIFSKETIPFHAFYFPSILLMTWYLGERIGVLTTGLVSLLWFAAERDVGHFQTTQAFLSNGVVYLVTFVAVFLLARLVRHKSLLLEKTSAELARSNSELEHFAYKAAHDLRSPLTTIFGFTEFLVEKFKNANDVEAKECTDGILRGVRSMNAMIKALLEYATVMKEEKDAPLADLEKVIAETLENLRVESLEKKASITHDPLPVLAISPGLAGVLFQNLIGNAMKYCEKEPRVHLSAVRKGKEWLFSIQDNGIGIPEESRERVFVMFEKLLTRQKYPGSGIGLATCQKIVERYGGRIWVESNPGGGSTFFFTLPAH